MTKEELTLELTKLIAERVGVKATREDVDFSEAIAEAYNKIYNSINLDEE
ncbi:hypothetical protein P6P36_03620 [Clostridium perfringens]|nr:hypothetical protein [Clostridium perfringens]MDK0531467.1 hypothetical protein [Clostridium perfringens]MDT7931500.1 hypothetical protein [Clostridium perfringens]MDT7955286.1 hypothetical protein [Clostridium perfringens]